MTTSATPEHDLQDYTWRTSLYRSLALIVLAASVAAGPLALWQALSGRNALYVLALAALVAAMGSATTERLGRPSWRQRRGLAYRVGEGLVVLTLARVATWAFDAGWPTAAQAAFWLRTPAAFLDSPFLFAATTLLLAWAAAISSTSDFLDLALRPDEIAAQQPHGFGDDVSRWRVAQPLARMDILARFAKRWIWGGVALVVTAALVRVDVQMGEFGRLRVGLRDLGLPPVVLAGLLAYFLAGLLLISDARLAVLRAQWFNQQVTVTAPVLKRWRASSLLVVGLVALLALSLPLGASGWLAQALLWCIALLIRIGMFLQFILSLLLMLLLYPLRWLFRQNPAAESPAEIPAPTIPTQAEAASRLPDWLGGVLVWGVVALVAGYLLWNFLRANGLLTGWPALFARLRERWAARRRGLGAALRSRLARLRLRTPRPLVLRAPGHSLRFSALSSRERVRYFYLVTLRRAAERGRARPSHKTPQEFLGDLTAAWPEAQADTQALTEAFLAARYAPDEVEADRVRTAHDIWRRVMRALRRPAGE